MKHPLNVRDYNLGVPDSASEYESATSHAAKIDAINEYAAWRFSRPLWMGGRFKFVIQLYSSGNATKNVTLDISGANNGTAWAVKTTQTTSTTFVTNEQKIEFDIDIPVFDCIGITLKLAEAPTVSLYITNGRIYMPNV